MKKVIYVFISLLLVGSLSIILFDFGLTVKQTDNILKVIPAFFAASALIVTVSLYDKFGLKKFIYEKKLRAVLEILEAYKSQNIYMQAYHETLGVILTNKIEISLAASHKIVFKIIASDVSNKIVLIDDESIAFIDKLNELTNSPYLPPILTRIPKLTAVQYPKEPFDKEKYVLLSFGEKRNTLLLDEKHSFSKITNYKNHRGLTLESFVETYQKALIIIRDWIKQETNLTDINY